MILQIGEVILTSEIITEFFCCDLEKCKGICCVEGDSGAPLLMEEVAEMENVLDDVWQDLSAKAQSVIDRHGVACTDADGDLVRHDRGRTLRGRTKRSERERLHGASRFPVPSTRFGKSDSETGKSACNIIAGRFATTPSAKDAN